MVSKLCYRLLLIGLIIITTCNRRQPTEVPQGGNPSEPAVITTPASSSVIVYATPRNDIAGVSNFARVSEALYRGAQPTKKGFAELKKMGIKTIVNLRAMSSDRDELKGQGLYYCHIQSVAYDVDDDEVIAFLKVVTNHANHPIFVHCQHGADRTGAMCAVYRIYVQGWSKEDALKELYNFGHHELWKNIPRYIRHFDTGKMKARAKTAPEPKVELVE